jgi:hypothetical protein
MRPPFCAEWNVLGTTCLTSPSAIHSRRSEFLAFDWGCEQVREAGSLDVASVGLI